MFSRDIVLICVWKNFWRENFCEVKVETDERRIKQVTECIFKIDHDSPEQVSNLITEIATLFRASRSLSFKLASVALTVVFPDKYGIFDTRIARVLQIPGEDEISCAKAIFRMREVAKEQEDITGSPWTPRMVDMALWSLDKFGP